MVHLQPAQFAFLAGAALIAGAVNAVAGGGSLISFPALLAVGYPGITANITNSVALFPGYLGGVLGYRRELEGQAPRVRALGLTSAAGALLGAFLLVVSSAAVFERIVPFLILLACALLAVQAPLSRLVKGRTEAPSDDPVKEHRPPALYGAQFLAAAYGAYFGAGVGIMMLAILGIFLHDRLQRLNALKGFMSLLITAVAVVYFVVFAQVAWLAVPVMAVASLVGGQLGVVLARRLHDQVLRWLVIAFGVAVAMRLLLRS